MSSSVYVFKNGNGKQWTKSSKSHYYYYLKAGTVSQQETCYSKPLFWWFLIRLPKTTILWQLHPLKYGNRLEVVFDCLHFTVCTSQTTIPVYNQQIKEILAGDFLQNLYHKTPETPDTVNLQLNLQALCWLFPKLSIDKSKVKSWC